MGRNKLFLDSDVILDVFATREPFYAHSAMVLSLAEANEIIACTSPLTFANIQYILRKHKSKSYALQSLQKLRLLIKVTVISESHIDQALNSTFTDFEDAIQYYSALSEDVNFIVTRNKKDYKQSTISVCSAEEYLAIHTATK